VPVFSCPGERRIEPFFSWHESPPRGHGRAAGARKGKSPQVVGAARPQLRKYKYMNTNIERYGSRFWAIYRDGELLAVTVYKKGAMRLQQILQNHQAAKEEISTTTVMEES